METNGSKILVFGNHDRMGADVIKQFTRVYGAYPGGIAGNTLDKQYMILSHYPLRGWNGRAHDSIQLFGHCHGRLNSHRWQNTLDVGVDCDYANYAPISWDRVKDLVHNLPYVAAEVERDPAADLEEQINIVDA
jgi:calcineurin-like phosphoesterase family protein